MLSIDVTIVRAGDGPAWPDLNEPDDVTVISNGWHLAVVEAGMMSGAPSLELRLDGPDGQTVIGETSLAAWIAATCVLRGAFPDAFAGGPLA